MVVYVVYESDFDDKFIKAIYSSEQLAIKAVEVFEKEDEEGDNWYSYHYRGYEVKDDI
jgi:hypothetical protein